MKEQQIITLTVNPAIDKSANFSGLLPEKKIRCEVPRHDAGGGGINVSRAIQRLGGNSTAIFTSGGCVGHSLQNLMISEGLAFEVVEINEPTRENFVAFDTLTNSQYRFGFPGPQISKEEESRILNLIETKNPAYLVASGSLPIGLDIDFYSKVAFIAKNNNSKFIVDTSGEALKSILDVGVYLLKPNLAELSQLVGATSLELNEVENAAKELISQGKCKVVVVSLGAKGAQLVSKDFSKLVSAPVLKVKSTVGAGDSMVGGMVWSLANNKTLLETVQMGVACGSAATMNEGTQLFKKQDAVKLLEWIQKN